MKDRIEQKPLTDSVFEKLRSEILHGKLKPGDVLRQEEITERLGVSRTPVREAIQRLQMEGLVTLFPRRKAVVSTVTVRRISEIYDIRAQLEPFAAGLAVGRLSHKQMQRLSELIHEMEALDPKTGLEKILDKNREFHYIIYSAAENETLVAIIDQLWRDILRLRSLYLLTPHGHVDSTDEHRMILDALTARDPKKVFQLVQIHCEHSKATLLGVDTGVSRARGEVASEMAETAPEYLRRPHDIE